MKSIMAAFFIALAWSASAYAQTPVQMFPPENCISNTLMYIAWDKERPTSCISGQDMLKNTIPSCSNGQSIVYEGVNPNGQFICKTPDPAPVIPTCSANEYLSYDGTAYACKSTSAPPQCAANQVLTSTGSGMVCIEQSVSMPTCTEGQFLTYNGSAYQCADMSVAGAEWVDVNLDSVEQFDASCNYRYRRDMRDYYDVPWNVSTGWWYPSAIDKDALVLMYHSGAVTHINANSKRKYRLNGDPYDTSRPITHIQKKC